MLGASLERLGKSWERLEGVLGASSERIGNWASAWAWARARAWARASTGTWARARTQSKWTGLPTHAVAQSAVADMFIIDIRFMLESCFDSLE